MKRFGNKGRRLIGALCTLTVGLGAQDQTVLTALTTTGTMTTIQGPLAGKRTPVWRNGALLMLDESSPASPLITALDSSGKPVASVTVHVPGAVKVHLRGYTRNMEGDFVVCGGAFDRQDRQAPFIAFISQDGAREQIVRPEKYFPERIVLSAGGAIWTLGLTIPVDRWVRELEEGIIRRFGRDGKLEAKFIPGAMVNDMRRVREGGLVVSDDRVGWYSSGMDDRVYYVEILSDGTVKEHSAINLPEGMRGQRVTGGIILRDHRVFLCVEETAGGARSLLYTLDRSTGRWAAVDLPMQLRGPRQFRILGGDSEGFALAATPETAKVYWMRPGNQ